MPPVEVPATRSKSSATRRPVRSSSSASTSAGMIPRIPPPSMVRMRTRACLPRCRPVVNLAKAVSRLRYHPADMRDYLDAIRSRVVVFDGGMGATLEQFDLSLEQDYRLPGRAHEVLVLNRPDVIEGVHASMLDAGAEVVETDTFQGSRLKLGEWGLGDRTLEINRRAAEIARKAAGEHRFVAGSIGSTGYLPASDDPTLGQITFRELVTVFEEQARGLVEGGADLLIIETAQDILEVKAAIFGAREAFKALGRSVPIQTSVSLLPNGGKMLLGTDISAVLATLEALKVDVIGL